MLRFHLHRIVPFPLPPDPGEAGKATIAGIDSDNDGVRDDVQRWIALTFPDNPNIRAGLHQYAAPLQLALLDANSEEMALVHGNTKDHALYCLDAIVGIDDSYEYTSSLKAEMFNTEERSLAYIKYDSQLSGHTYHLLDASLNMYDFDLAKI